MRKELKRKRKEEKKLKKAQESEADMVAEEVVVEEVAEEKPKKDKKKKRKHENEESAASEEVLVEEPVKESKDKKKEKSRMLEICESLTKTDSGAAEDDDDMGNWVMHPETSALDAESIDEFRAEVGITMTLSDSDNTNWKPIKNFEYLNPSFGSLCPEVKAYIKAKKFTQPSAIQAQCWGPLLAGRDVIGIASTGSGKTMAFLVPTLLKLAKLGPPKNRSGSGFNSAPSPRVLVMAPTRELALQSHDVVVGIGACKGVCIYGGVPKQQQKADLRSGADVVVATPGRLLDLVEEGALSLADIRVVVLDEADRMLDEGFEPAIRSIVSKCPGNNTSANPRRQTIMFSATWPEEIRVLAHSFLRSNAVRVTVGSEELAANHKVTQIVECVEAFEKNKKLLALLDKYHKSRKNRVLIFVLYKKEAVTLQQFLESKGYNAGAIHGDKGQLDRMGALDSFKTGQVPLLIATDVAARGLDIPQVEVSVIVRLVLHAICHCECADIGTLCWSSSICLSVYPMLFV